MKRLFQLSRGRIWGWFLAVLGLSSGSGIHAGTGERVEFEGAIYHLYRVPAAESPKLELHWLGKDGQPLRDFPGLMKAVTAAGRHIAFATNAGIYEKGPKPCGLTISQGKELVPLNLRPGEGNFYLHPSGVFYVDDAKGAGVMESAEFGRSALQPRLATQSGPLLLRKGVFHPAFREGSPNKRLRNAVGVRASDGEVIFVMSDREDREKGRVTFHQLSRFYLYLGCQDALFLDGDISDMLVNPPATARLTPNTFAGMFVILK
ncbi:MAG: phosphodiester glycosidase family protein [Verrucomicrobium sp.]|nr:phosphodiester glycosidase family protein [Verrucomicrobium sp.]